MLLADVLTESETLSDFPPAYASFFIDAQGSERYDVSWTEYWSIFLFLRLFILLYKTGFG